MVFEEPCKKAGRAGPELLLPVSRRVGRGFAIGGAEEREDAVNRRAAAPASTEGLDCRRKAGSVGPKGSRVEVINAVLVPKGFRVAGVRFVVSGVLLVV